MAKSSIRDRVREVRRVSNRGPVKLERLISAVVNLRWPSWSMML
jgi:hypothetical protein